MMTTRKRNPRIAAIGAAFGAAAATYESDAVPQRVIAERLGARIGAFDLPPSARILEIGCGTGFLSRALRACFPAASLLVSDLSPAMVQRCRQALGPHADYLVMDGQHPCLAETGNFDLITSSLALQWFAEPGRALADWRQLLRPGGHIAFTTLVAGSFAEWHYAHAALNLRAGIPDYPSAASYADRWPDAGNGEIDVETLVHTYPDGHAFVTALKRIGAHVPAVGRTPLSPGALRQVLRRVAAPDGFAVTYQVAFGHFRADTLPSEPRS